MKKEILSILSCPSCKSGNDNLEIINSKVRNNEIISGFLLCKNGHKFWIKNYIANLCDESDKTMKDSLTYDKLWDLHEDVHYPGKVNEYKKKFNDFAKLPGNFKTYFNQKLILDVGCGEGRFSYLSSQMGVSHVISIDYSLTGLNRAIRQTTNPKNITFIRCNLLNLPFKNEIFDFIFSFGVLHHTKNTHNSFKSLLPYLKKKGIISIRVYRKKVLPLIQWILRPITLRIPVGIIAKFCNFFGFGYNVNIKPVIPVRTSFRKLKKLDFFGIGHITFEGLTTRYLWEHTYHEVRKWFKELDLDIISSTDIISMSGRKK